MRVLAITLLAAMLFAAIPATAATCESLAALALPNTTITTAQSIAAGSFKPPDGPAIAKVAAFCRVAGAIKTTSDSNIQFEVWLPSSGWNGKFQGVGNGGFAGVISFAGLADAVNHGYATASTDTGHHAGGIDATWALGHPEKLIDYGYRAIHETAEKAKAVIAAFYGEGPKRSYFNSCSNGGRQALMEAQRFPADYDGIIAGAPAASFTHIATQFLWNSRALTDDPASFIPAAKIPAIDAAALAACDALDGVKDGVIDDPTRCHFDPSELLCKGPESDACLTAPQVAALKKIYAGPRNTKGKPVFPGDLPGAESGSGGWALWVTGSAPAKSLQFGFGTQFYANMVYGNAAWDYKTFDVDRDTKAADQKAAGILNATDADLKRFKARGGKLIMYHGWSDAALPPVASVDYYRSVTAKMGRAETGAFLRLFMVPGMQHCGGGTGPNSFGQFGAAQGDPQHDIARALERWVEDGTAPEQIVATKYKGANPASGILRTRPLCPYPQVAHWNGTGSTDDAANFVCVAPAAHK